MAFSDMCNASVTPFRRNETARDISVRDAPFSRDISVCDPTSRLVLAGDIGGTNSRLRLFDVPNDAMIIGTSVPGTLVYEKIYPNENFERYESLRIPMCTCFGDQI